MNGFRSLFPVLLAACLGTGPGAHAQGAARSLDLDPSIRSAGMGGACNAVFWGSDLNDWANPALLGYQSGVRYNRTRTQLVPGLATDVFFTTQRLAIGWGGLGVGIPGDLDDHSSALLDYGSLSAFEEVRSRGLGVSLAELVGTSLRLMGRDVPSLLHYGDIAVGINDKHVLTSLGPGRGNARDYGVLVRATPVDRREGPGGGGRLPLRIDLSYGKSTLNYNDAVVTFPTESYFTSRTRRSGVAARAALGVTGSWRERLGGRDWLVRSLSPLVSLGITADRDRVTIGDSDSGFRIRRYGGEVSFVNVLHVRVGHVNDSDGQVVGGTYGWGLGLNLSDVIGFRYERATIPQARTLPDVKNKGSVLFVDLMALAGQRRHADSHD